MALGKTHRRFNNLVSIALVPALLELTPDYQLIFLILLGYFLSTYILGPDLDLGPRKIHGPFGILLWPYSYLCKHRGKSHHLLWGPLGRALYLLIVGGFLMVLINGLTGVDDTITFLLAYRREALAIFAGLCLGDWCHVLLDKLSSFKLLS